MSVLQFPDARSEQHQASSDGDVDIVIPVYNEAEQLAVSINALRTYLDASFPYVTTITIADNASTDGTWEVAVGLAATLANVQAIHLDQKGRGRALRAAWMASDAAVVSYMDVDLATGLEALLPLVAPLLSGHSDLAIGTRLAPGAHVVRGTRREFISRGYNLLVRSALRSTTTDAQCGFKAMRREAALQLLPLVDDDEWFFDTEVLVTAQRIGLRIHEVPVDWVDDTDSRVEVLHTAWKDLRGVWRMLGPTSRQRAAAQSARLQQSAQSVQSAQSPTEPYEGSSGPRPVGLPSDRTPSTRANDEHEVPPAQLSLLTERSVKTSSVVFADELLRFAGVGAISTVAYAGLFAALEPSLGSYLANGVAIGLCSLGNTAAHRGMAGAARHGLDRTHRVLTASTLLGVSLVFTTGALATTRALGLTSLLPQLAAVTAANAAAAIIRFGILRTWVFRPEFGTHLTIDHPSDDGTLRRDRHQMTRTPS